MKGCPKSLGHISYLDAKRRDDRRQCFESGPQFGSGASFGEPQIRWQDKHGVVKRGTIQRKREIGQGDILEGVSSCRSARCFAKCDREFLEALDCNCRNNRIPVLEM